jgi:hypothetical protein
MIGVLVSFVLAFLVGLAVPSIKTFRGGQFGLGVNIWRRGRKGGSCSLEQHDYTHISATRTRGARAVTSDCCFYPVAGDIPL